MPSMSSMRQRSWKHDAASPHWRCSCTVALLDFIDVIVNVVLPSTRRDPHFSVRGLVWVPSGWRCSPTLA
jgi:hypothetical protein